MKGLLPLLVISALSPLPVFADSKAYLVILGNEETGFEVVPMSTLDQCEEQGAKWLSSTRIQISPKWRGFECLESEK